ncbi:MAG TPA: hypothetical protein TECP_01197 [Hyphomicrobiaceae bacterium MAG_BT-2024]
MLVFRLKLEIKVNWPCDLVVLVYYGCVISKMKSRWVHTFIEKSTKWIGVKSCCNLQVWRSVDCEIEIGLVSN